MKSFDASAQSICLMVSDGLNLRVGYSVGASQEDSVRITLKNTNLDDIGHTLGQVQALITALAPPCYRDYLSLLVSASLLPFCKHTIIPLSDTTMHFQVTTFGFLRLPSFRFIFYNTVIQVLYHQQNCFGMFSNQSRSISYTNTSRTCFSKNFILTEV